MVGGLLQWRAGKVLYTSSSLYRVISWFRQPQTRNSSQVENETVSTESLEWIAFSRLLPAYP
jgi:hypothetical protein